MKSTTIEKDKILNYIIYAEFYVSQISISIKRVPNITIDQEDLKSSILNIRNSIKKIKRFIERDKEIKDIEQIYSSSKKQFIYLIDLMDIHWKKDYIGIKNSFDRFNYEKKFSKIFDEKEQKEIIKKRNQSSGFLKTFIWRILISYNLILKSAEILNIQLRGINFDYKIDAHPALFDQLIECENITALKESSRDVTNLIRMKNRFGDRFKILCGVDTLAMEELCLEADGLVAGLVCAFPKETMAIYNLVKAGKIAEAAVIYRWFMPLLELDIHPKLVQYIKLAATQTGISNEYVRAPRLVLEGEERERVLGIIKQGIATRPVL